MLHGARVGLVGVIGRSARRIDSAGVATQAQGIILTVSFVDSAGPRAASPPAASRRRLSPVPAPRGPTPPSSSATASTCALGVPSPPRTRSAARSAPIPRTRSSPTHAACRPRHNLRRTSLLGRRAQPRDGRCDAAGSTMPGRRMCRRRRQLRRRSVSRCCMNLVTVMCRV